MNQMKSVGFSRAILDSPFGWIVLIAANVSYVFMTRVERPFLEARLGLQTEILQGSALEPYRFRILMPYLGEAGQNFLAGVLPLEWAHLLTFFSLNFIFVAITLWNVWNLRASMPVQGKIISVLSFGLAANIGLFDHFYQPWSLLEVAIVSTAFALAVRGNYGWLPLLTLIGTLNSDTGAVLPIAILTFFILSKEKGATKLGMILSAGLIGVLTFLALRVLIGPGAQVTSVIQALEINISGLGLLKLAINLALMFGVGWYSLSWGGRGSDYRHIWISFLPYLLLVMIFGVWLEVRLLLPLVWLLSVQIGEATSRIDWGMGQSSINGGDERI